MMLFRSVLTKFGLKRVSRLNSSTLNLVETVSVDAGYVKYPTVTDISPCEIFGSLGGE